MVSFKIALMGYDGVGKSCFLERFHTGNFGVEKLIHLQTDFPTSEGKVEVEVVARPAKIDDTYNGVIAMFSLADPKSAGYARGVLSGFEIANYKIPIVVVGNQTDRSDVCVDAKYIQTEFIDKGYEYIQCSAKSLYNYEKPFLCMFRKLTGVEDLKFVASEQKIPEVNRLDFDNSSTFAQEMVLRTIDGVIRTASKYGGKVHGSYLQNVLVPRFRDPKCKVSFDTLNLWFNSWEKSYVFIKEIKPFLSAPIQVATSCCDGVPYGWNQYNYIVNDTILCMLAVVTSEVYPMKSIEAEYLTAFYETDGSIKFDMEVLDPKATSIDNLLSQVERKEGVVTDVSDNILKGGSPKLSFLNLQMYHREGWKIIVNGNVASSENLESGAALRKWVQQSLKSERELRIEEFEEKAAKRRQEFEQREEALRACFLASLDLKTF